MLEEIFVNIEEYKFTSKKAFESDNAINEYYSKALKKSLKAKQIIQPR